MELKWAKMSNVAEELMVEAMGLHGGRVSFQFELEPRDRCAHNTYESSVMVVTMTMAIVFLAEGQFIGFSGSLGPSKSTTLGSFPAVSADFSPTDDLSTSVSAEIVSGTKSLICVSVPCDLVLQASAFSLAAMADGFLARCRGRDRGIVCCCKPPVDDTAA